MATKAELQAELADLRRQMSAQVEGRQGSSDRRDERGDTVAYGQVEEGVADGADDAGHEIDWETELADVLQAVEDMPQKKPMMFALAALALGYVLGRIR